MSKGYGVFGHVPDNADDDDLLPYEDDDSGVSWAMRCAVAILGKGEATKVPITTMIGMAQMTQMALMRTGASLPARAAV